MSIQKEAQKRKQFIRFLAIDRMAYVIWLTTVFMELKNGNY